MFHSLRAPHLALRIALAIVFLGFGVHKFVEPMYWVNAWVPLSVQSFVQTLGMSPGDFIFLNGIFEVLVGVSLVSGYFIRIFAGAGLLFLLSVMAVHLRSATEIIVRDIGLAGGLIALLVWPDRTW